MVTIGANQNLEKIKEEVLAFAERMKDRELVILGHDNIDVDAVLSGILLNFLTILKSKIIFIFWNL